MESGRVRMPRALVVREPPPEGGSWQLDWSSWRVTDEEDMGQSPEQSVILRVFEGAVEEQLRETGRSEWFVGTDAFFGWVEEEPLVRVSPDVYVLDHRPSAPWPASWQTWRPGHRPPLLALEVTSVNWKKDYDDAPERYAMLGVRELIVFDPKAARGAARRADRMPLQVFRRERDGALVLVHAGGGPAWSDVLGAWLVIVTVETSVYVRLARDASGVDLVPIPAEALAEERLAREDAERAKADAERAKADAERAKADAERAKADAENALSHERAERRRLEAELAALRSKG